MNFMESIQQSNQDFKDKLISLSKALHLCLLVSNQCAERGQLLHSQIKGYILIFHKHFMILKFQLCTKLLDFVVEEQEKRSQKFQLFEKDINESKQREWMKIRSQVQINQLKQEIDMLKQKDNIINSECISYQQTINKLQNKINLLQAIKSASKYDIIQNKQTQASLNEQIRRREIRIIIILVLKELNQQNEIEQIQDEKAKNAIEILPVVCHSFGIQTFQKCLCIIETQTDLQQMSSQYDNFLSILEIENTFKEFELKNNQNNRDGWMDYLTK
ncbi:unnamed protein product [Paramecium sonneborni]|uniref:Uncharacterized protein n=1 Tax=Paramecium sonneborni TaxID=65129 RepID=A0A8S1RUC7_9CILI|nr:unnamed protein product [Paramecium sonneborni]